MTGARDAIWAVKVSKSEGISFHELHNRLREDNDRLCAQYGGSGLSRQPSDDEEGYSRFPDHPLSRVRRYLPLLASSVTLAGKAQRLAPFP